MIVVLAFLLIVVGLAAWIVKVAGWRFALNRLGSALLIVVIVTFATSVLLRQASVDEQQSLALEEVGLPATAQPCVAALGTGADVETVLKMYHDGFVDTFERYRRFDPEGFFAAWAGLKWGESEAALLASALSFAARHCQLRNSLGPLSLRLEGNRFGRTGETAIRAAIVGSKTFERVLF